MADAPPPVPFPSPLTPGFNGILLIYGSPEAPGSSPHLLLAPSCTVWRSGACTPLDGSEVLTRLLILNLFQSVVDLSHAEEEGGASLRDERMAEREAPGRSSRRL